MNILITGSTGLIGSALVPSLITDDHRVTRLVRSKPLPGEAEVHWNPEAGEIDTDSFKAFKAVVHLAGENIAGGRWTAERKARIRDSRVQGTRLLSESLANLTQPPKVLVCASAIGYYGDRGEEILNEESPSGTGFLPEVCREWETATEPATQSGIRVVHLRFGVVLSAAGGALAKMLFPFRLGVGGRIGSGRQYMSWIALDDGAGAIRHALITDTLEGPVNVVAPHPVTNREFTKILGRVLGRPTVFPMPAFAARLALGEMAEALLLSSARVEPARLLATGYEFHYPELEAALQHLLENT
ncbi:MAG: TIGR01777 family oxidoreductase [Candidatus Poribacteria bacterium]|nr:TIGR01777 family oxidoreductase [Candidatus Poribacteria bacterium]